MEPEKSIVFEKVSKKYQVYQGGRSLRKDLDALFKKMLSFGRYHHADLNTFWALKDLSFSLKQGETLGIIGTNGSGKSTTLKLISRIAYPTQGHIHILGRVASLIEVGAGFHLELTGRENIYQNGSILGMAREEIRAKFDEIVHFAEVEQFIDTPIKRYSYGMRARLGFAIAVHVSPDILLVDEVLSVGDERFQQKSLKKMRDMMSSGRTVIFVSHHLDSVAALCPRVIWLHKGVMRADGEGKEVIAHYRDAVVDEEERDHNRSEI